MWATKHNLIVAFPLDHSEVSAVRKALWWGATHQKGRAVEAPINGIRHELRTFQFDTGSQRQLARERLVSALSSVAIDVLIEDEVGKAWAPDRSV